LENLFILNKTRMASNSSLLRVVSKNQLKKVKLRNLKLKVVMEPIRMEIRNEEIISKRDFMILQKT